MELSNNPLLGGQDMPAFSSICPEHILPAIGELTRLARQALDTVTAPAFAADWNDIATVLDVATERLSRTWSVLTHLNAVASNDVLRKAYNEALPMVTAFWTQMGADENLYNKYRQIKSETLNTEQQQSLRLILRNFTLSGAELDGEARQRFAEIQIRLAQLGQIFSENVLDATDGWCYNATLSEVAGLPEDLLQAIAVSTEQDGQNACYRLSLQMPVVQSVMRFAHSRQLRERVYRANAVRASDLAPPENRHQDNSPVIDEILTLRAEKSRLLGFANYAELSLSSKMADSAEQVMDFLRMLAERTRSAAVREVNELRLFAQKQFGLSEPQDWDWAYLSEQLRQSRYCFSEQEIKPYFRADRVLKGLFNLAERLFDIRIHSEDADVWHPATQCFRIERSGRLLGRFYLDTCARTGKRGGAWMSGAVSRWLRPDTGKIQTPVSYLVCNFTEGVENMPTLLTHREVITLFHEFGHGIHHLLTQVNELRVSGIYGVEWDAIELPSQFMENFCWEWPVLTELSAHIETGEPLPYALYQKMLAARNFQSGMETLRQIQLAMLDMELHIVDEPNVLSIQETVHQEIAVLPVATFIRQPHAFSHIFAGPYAAGYYSYKWAEVLSADVYAAFAEEALTPGVAAPETGKRYLRNILETGGSRPMLVSFEAFRGRQPQKEAFLRHHGIPSGTRI